MTGALSKAAPPVSMGLAQLLASKQAESDGMYKGIQFSNPDPSWWQQGGGPIGYANPSYTLCAVSNNTQSFNASNVKNGK